MAKGLVKSSAKKGNYGTPVSYTRQNSYKPARSRKKR